MNTVDIITRHIGNSKEFTLHSDGVQGDNEDIILILLYLDAPLKAKVI